MTDKVKRFLPFSLSILGTILSFSVTFILTRSLGKQRYGEIQYWIGIINTFSAFSAFGIPNFLVRDGKNIEEKKDFFGKCIFAFLLLNLIAFPLFFIISYFFLTELYKNILLIILIILCSISSSFIVILQYIYLTNEKKNKSVIVSSVAFKGSLLIISTFFVVFNLENALFKYFALIYFISYLIVILPSLINKASFGNLSFNKSEIICILMFFLISITSSVSSQVSKVLLGEAGNGDYSAVAIFSLCVQCLGIISSVTTLITTLSRPKFSELIFQKDYNSLENLYKKNIRITCRIAIPFYLGVCIQQTEVLSLFSSEYSGYPLIMVFLVMAYLYSDICGPAGTLMAMGKLEKKELLINVIQLVVYVLIASAFLSKMYFCIPLAIFASYVVSYSLRALIIKKEFGFNVIDLKTFFEICVESVVSITVFLGLKLIDNMVLKILLDVICGFILIAIFNFLPFAKSDLDGFFEKI